MKLRAYSSSRSRQSGMTVIEIMIAMLLGLVLMGGVLQVFSSSRQSYRVQESISRMQETGRMALEVVSRDIRMAGFWGCASDAINVVNNLNTAGTNFVDFSAGGLGAIEGASGAPDTLVLRGGINAGIGLQPPFGPSASDPLNISTGNGLEQDDFVIVSDCTTADIFQLSNADADTTGALEHTTAAASPGNSNVTDPGCAGANAHCLSKIYGADANVFTTQQITYAIGTGSEGQPALFRNGLEFLDGIEDFQVLYGEDLDLDNVANYYVPASQVADMQQVISIRFAIVTRSYDDNLNGGSGAQAFNVLGTNVTATDSRLRQVYTSTVNLRNRL